MSDPRDEPIDAAAHRHLAVDLFNETWRHLSTATRTELDDLDMLGTALTSRYHWRQVGGPLQFAVSDWQVSRALAALGEPALARRFGQASLAWCRDHDLPAFYLGYAHEALARAAALANDPQERDRHLKAAHAQAELVTDPEERRLLIDDLDSLG